MKKSKFLSLLLALSMVFALLMPAMADETTAPEPPTPYTVPADVSGKLVILHTNDTHGGDMAVAGKSIGTAGVAQLKKDFEAAGAEVLLLSAGDATQGAPLVNLSQGAAAIEFLNAAGYAAMCPGNHEFDWGSANLQTITKAANFPILAANVLDKSTGKPLFGDNHVFTLKSGLKVGVFGLDTPEAATKTNPEKIKGVTFLAGKDLIACAQTQVDTLKAAGCDLIVALGHLGVDEETAATGNRSVDVCNSVKGIDLFVDGHSHTVMEGGKPVDAAKYPSFDNKSNTLIVSTGTKLAYVGAVVYDPAAKALSSSLIAAANYTAVDPTVNQLVTDKNTEVDATLSKVIGRTEVTLDGNRDPGVRTQETNLGDFATDAILWFAQQENPDVDAAITNGGGIRDSIPAGDISMKTMNTVFPFGNTVATVTVTGQQLLEALEAATFCTPTSIGAFPQVAGITFTLDTTGVYENGAAYGTYFECANPGARVKNVTVAGEPLDLTKNYVVATNDFTAVGGDTYYPFADAASTMIDTGIPLDQALSEYSDKVLGGVISAEKYGKPAGRITILTAASTPEVPAESPAPVAPVESPAPVAPVKPTTPTGPSTVTTYVVKSGDCLWNISQYIYGTGAKWEIIYRANTDIIKDPSAIQVGQVLEIPAA